MFFDSGLDSKEQVVVLRTLRSYTNLGVSLPDAIGILRDIETNNKFLKIYTNIFHLIFTKHYNPADALHEARLLNSFELFLLKNNINTREAITNILEIREKKSLYDFQLLKMFILPYAIYIATLYAIPFLKGFIINVEAGLIEKTLKRKRIDVTGQLVYPDWATIPNVEFYCYSLIFFMILGASMYLYYSNKNPYKLYSVFKGKAYSDVAILFNIMLILRKTGRGQKEIVKRLLSSGEFSKERQFLVQLDRSKTIYDVCQKFNIPIDVVHFLKSGEQTKSLWTNMPEIIEFCESSKELSLSKMDLYVKLPIFWSSLTFALYIVATTILMGIGIMGMYLNMSGI